MIPKTCENIFWQNATLNAEYVTGTCKYLTLKNVLIVSILDLKVIKKIEHGTIIISGLPKNIGETFLLQQFSTNAAKRLLINSSGNIIDWYDPIDISNNQFYATVITTLT